MTPTFKPLISVIVPAYEVGPYVRQCINAILNQTFKNFELIVSLRKDNKDDTISTVSQFSTDPRVKIIFQSGRGLSNARNSAIYIAKGKYITFVDGDDIVKKDYLQTLVVSMSDDVDIVCTLPEFTNHLLNGSDRNFDDRIGYFSFPFTGKHKIDTNLAIKIPVVAWGKLYKSSIINKYKILFPEGLIFEDNFFFYSYLSVATKNIVLSPKKVYIYNLRDGSLFGILKSRPSMGIDNIHILEKIVDFLEHYKCFQFETPKLYAKYYLDALKFSGGKFHREIDNCLYKLIMNKTFLFKLKFLFYFCKNKANFLIFIYFFILLMLNCSVKIFIDLSNFSFKRDL
ncbi:MAG: glycosyltransferase family 2 protein [Mesosutterella sp.]|nr:glycosyltransferase family 2 protein [Mesosutterella sp.]